MSDGEEITFLSDVHLGLGSAEHSRKREEALIQLLRKLGATSHLFIVGDLFDYWFDYPYVIPSAFVRTVATLGELRENGLPITYLMGNHDFGHYRFFQESLGISVEESDISLTIGMVKLYISHGDGKAANDRGYIVLRSVLRNPFMKAVYRLLHPSVGIGLAARTSQRSRAYTDKRDYGTDGLRDFAHRRIAEGYDFVVMGHKHQPCYEQVGAGVYVNLGDWLNDTATYATYIHGKGVTLHTVPIA